MFKFDDKGKGGKGKNSRCSFCGKAQDEVQKLIAGPGVGICDECVHLCTLILNEEKPEAPGKKDTFIPLSEVPKPREIKAYLDQYVIGQDWAKKSLSEPGRFPVSWRKRKASPRIFENSPYSS